MNATPAIIVDDVSKQFPNAPRPSVDHCSFQIEQGQLIVFLGPSGCGKTTMLKMINRLYEPTGGRILVDGNDVTQLKATELRRRIGYVIQQTGLFPHMRIEDNVATVPQLLGWKHERINTRIDELLELMSLPNEYRKRYPRQLSGGEQQRVGIARALAADPTIMLMDEPFGAIDAITRARLQDELLSLQRKLHKTILFVTHDVDEALRLADKILIMRRGKIVQFAPPLEILTEPADEFVAQLVDAGDLMRRLSLINVGAVAKPTTHQNATNAAPQIHASETMRAALSILLGSGANMLNVVDGDGRVIGSLTLEDVQSVTSDTRAMLNTQQPVAL
jgi:osmoprotectant transport system ATP-binding protein